MKKKIISLLMLIVMIAGLTACGKGEVTDKGTNTVFNKGLKANDLSISDFVWETKKTYIKGNEYYATSIVNNSKYDLLATEVYYKVKDDVSDDQLNVFDGFMEEHKDWFDDDETKRDISLVGSKTKLTKSGETMDAVTLAIGMGKTYWYDSPDTTQFNLMEPDRLELGIVKDDILYIAYYDFVDSSWALDEETVQLNTWSKNEFAKKITKPTCDYYHTSSDLDDEEDITFTAYGTTKEYFKEYVEIMKNIGFSVDADDDYNTYFTAEDENGNEISISFNDDSKTFKVDISLK